MKLSLIAAVSKKDWIIGQDGGLPWHLPSDLEYFKEYTRGKAVIMGRRTADSLRKALPKRTNIVVASRYKREGFIHVNGITEAFDAVPEGMDAVAIGGHHIYNAVMPLVAEASISWVHEAMPTAPDTFFPTSFLDFRWKAIEEDLIRDTRDEFPYTRTLYRKL